MEAGTIHVRLVPEKVDEGVLASTAGASEMDRSETQPHPWRHCAHCGQHSTSKLLAHGESSTDFSRPEGICASGACQDEEQLSGPAYYKDLFATGG